jgi:hypothetical protein
MATGSSRLYQDPLDFKMKTYHLFQTIQYHRQADSHRSPRTLDRRGKRIQNYIRSFYGPRQHEGIPASANVPEEATGGAHVGADPHWDVLSFHLLPVLQDHSRSLRTGCV